MKATMMWGLLVEDCRILNKKISGADTKAFQVLELLDVQFHSSFCAFEKSCTDLKEIVLIPILQFCNFCVSSE
jgi:hypothetical protein